jgi:molybdopterin-guanine dinucleotide biosynthesis protein A
MITLTAGHLQKLASFSRPGCGVLPVCDGSMEPLGAFYPAEALHAVRRAIPITFPSTV